MRWSNSDPLCDWAVVPSGLTRVFALPLFEPFWRDRLPVPQYGQEHTRWFNIKAFGKRAEIVAEHLHKGSRIFLEGRQRTESWDYKQSGGKKYMTFVYADKIGFLGESRRDGQKGELTGDQSNRQEDPTNDH